MAAVLGPRPAAVARELTKLYETVVRGPLDQPRGAFEEHQGGAKGFQLLQEGASGGALRRRKAGEQEAVGGQAGDGEAGQHRRGARDGDHLGALRRGLHRQPIARVRDQR